MLPAVTLGFPTTNAGAHVIGRGNTARLSMFDFTYAGQPSIHSRTDFSSLETCSLFMVIVPNPSQGLSDQAIYTVLDGTARLLLAPPDGYGRGQGFFLSKIFAKIETTLICVHNFFFVFDHSVLGPLYIGVKVFFFLICIDDTTHDNIPQTSQHIG